MTLNVMLHDDWELYGDGEGDIEKLMFDPARRLLDICDRYGARYTFFAEIGQQLAMRSSSDARLQSQAKTWETVLADAVRRGHDVQLHLHPQWIGATWRDGRWSLDFGKWSVALLPVETMRSVLREAAEYLCSLLKPCREDYDVVAFRSGSWMVQPSGDLIRVLKEIGVLADVTVIRGLRMTNRALGSIDFTAAPSSLLPWTPDPGDMAKAGGRYDGFCCIPTYSQQTRLPAILFSLLKSSRSLGYDLARRKAGKASGYTPIYQRSGQSPSGESSGRIARLFRRRAIPCDFGIMHWSTILSMMASAKRELRDSGESQAPFVLYAHAKSFHGYDNFRSLLERLKADPDVHFRTTRQVVRDVTDFFTRDRSRVRGASSDG